MAGQCSKTSPPFPLSDGFHVDHLKLLAEHVTSATIAEDCIMKCCQMGPERCQYVWIVWKQCYAVACSAGSDACQPAHMSSAGFNSIYIEVTLSDSTKVPAPTRASENIMERVLEEDSSNQPPIANAGPDVVIHFPEETSVTLDGTLSTDDKVRRGNNG